MLGKADLNVVRAHQATSAREQSPDLVSLSASDLVNPKDQSLVGARSGTPPVLDPGLEPAVSGKIGTDIEVGGQTWLMPDRKPACANGGSLEAPGYSADQMGFLAGEQPPAAAGGVQETFYHHIDWSGWSGKSPLDAGVGVLRSGHLSSGRSLSVDTWHGVLRECRDGTVTLVFSPDMPAQERVTGIFQRSAGSGINLVLDRHLEGVLYTGRSIPPELTEAVAGLNVQRQECGLPAVDLLPWKMFADAWGG